MKPFLPIVEVANGTAGVESTLRAVHELFETEQSCALVPAGSAAAAKAVRPDLPLFSTEPALVLVTSGSMGEPKAVELPLSALASSAEAAAIEFGCLTTWLTALPVTGIGGLNTLIRTALSGSAPVIWDGIAGGATFNAADFLPYLKAVRKSADKQNMAAAVSLVPTQVERMRGDSAALSALAALDFVLVGGAALSTPTLEALNQADVNLIRTYGATESSGGVVWNHKPIGDTQISVTPDSEIEIASSMLASFYRDGTAIAPRWSTGDLGSWNGTTLEVFGRVDRVIKSKGKKVSLDALTKMAQAVPGVLQAIAVGIADIDAGQLPVVAYEGTLTELELQIEIERLGDVGFKFKTQRFDELPLLANGKPDTAAISAICQTLRP